tara:strand:+ start:3223 stop:3840 length:618 start_codon:yes stop_codon:yes gene_type:complete
MNNLIDALLQAQKEIEHATKDANNPFFKSGYATLEQVINTVKEPLNRNGIYFQQNSKHSEAGAVCETIFYGHSAQLSAGEVFVPADKHDPQAFGSALTYSRRYSLSMACGIGSSDDDGETAMQRDKGKYKMIGTNGKVILSRDSEEDYLKDCGRMMKDANNVLSKKVYKTNVETIKKAKDASTGEIKESYERLIALYEGGNEAQK